MNIDKDIEILEDFIKKDYEPWSFYEKQGDELFELQEAIKLVLWYMNDYKNENVILHNELETYKKMFEKLSSLYADEISAIDSHLNNFCDEKRCIGNHDEYTCEKCMYNWARKEVEDE